MSASTSRAITAHTARRALVATLLVAAFGGLLGCAPQESPERPRSTGGTSAATDTLSGDLTVFAAASLEPAFERLGASFEALHPSVDLSFTYDGSSVLATQILAGAPADVFASADEANMLTVVQGGLIEGVPTTFATSELVIAVAPENPLGISDLTDLAAPTTDGAIPVVVTCALEVPCGTASQKLLTRDGVELAPASEEQNVTAVLTKVAAGEADAGLVYASDVLRSGGDVEGIEIADASDAAGAYVIAPLNNAGSPEAARAFIEYLTTTDAQQLLEDLGYRAP